MTPTPSPAFLRGPVSTLQEMLRTISHVDRAIPFLRPTGIFDEDTLAAVMTFQKVHGRPVTGVVDQQNWNAIQMAYLQAAQQLTPPCDPVFPGGCAHSSGPAPRLPGPCAGDVSRPGPSAGRGHPHPVHRRAGPGQHRQPPLGTAPRQPPPNRDLGWKYLGNPRAAV